VILSVIIFAIADILSSDSEKSELSLSV